MPSGQINDFSKKGNRKKIELVARPDADHDVEKLVDEVASLSLQTSQHLQSYHT